MVVVRELTRAQIVMYVGAAGDFHPLHHDDAYARSKGYPGVFAPGMLTMAMTGRAVTDAVRDGSLRQFGGRLTGQVWPGETLRTPGVPVGTTGEPDTGTVEHSVTTVNQHGMTVFDGQARAVEELR